jgi:hypothetical protein
MLDIIVGAEKGNKLTPIITNLGMDTEKCRDVQLICWAIFSVRLALHERQLNNRESLFTVAKLSAVNGITVAQKL